MQKGKQDLQIQFSENTKETFVNRPNHGPGESASDEEKERYNQETAKVKKSMKQLADLLTTLPRRDMTIDEILEEAGFENYASFQTALSLVALKPEIIMRRDPADVWVNGYNPDLLRCWRANMDIQYIIDPYSCVMYILSYISKAEHELGQILRSAQAELKENDSSQDLRAQMKKLGTVYFENREVSIQESVVRTCGLQLKDSPRQVVFVSTDNNARMSKKMLRYKLKLKSIKMILMYG